MKTLHIVEPGLVSSAGHSYELSRSLVIAWRERSRRAAVCLWAGIQLSPELKQGRWIDERVFLHCHFHRSLRKIQAFFLYRRQWVEDSLIVLPTARLLDLLTLWLARPAYPLGQAVAYMHWIKDTPWRLGFLRWLTARMPELRILTTTEHLCATLRDAGIARVEHQPYPLTPSFDETPPVREFRHLLYAGAAREDKGFPVVVDLLERLAALGTLPRVVVQVNGEKSVDAGPDVSESIQRLRGLAASHAQIQIIEESLPTRSYQDLFKGAVVLQLYQPSVFSRRVSGVTLDALSAGAVPIVCRGTWSASILEKFSAGVVADRQEVSAFLVSEINRLTNNFANESSRSQAAHEQLRRQANWSVLLDGLAQAAAHFIHTNPTNATNATIGTTRPTEHSQSPPRRILVVQMRRIGDVLLTTPIIRSLRQAFPNAHITALVFDETVNAVKGLADLDEVLSLPSRPSWFEQLGMVAKVFQSFDLSFCPSTSDRPLLLARLSARRCFAFSKKGWEWMFTGTVPFDDLDTHTVVQNLRLIHLLGVPVCPVVTPPMAPLPPHFKPATPYVVLHPFPKFEYKKWRLDAWQSLIDALIQAQFNVVISGGADSEEKAHNAALLRATNLTGCLSLGELSSLLGEASAYVGPDTATTHMAASLGIPTVAIFGPSNPVKWGPWPAVDSQSLALGIDQSPWQPRGSQQSGNVSLVQGLGDCVPCRLEGCDRHIASKSQCLVRLEPAAVLNALRALNLSV